MGGRLVGSPAWSHVEWPICAYQNNAPTRCGALPILTRFVAFMNRLFHAGSIASEQGIQLNKG
ncbi:MAG: hypothetical protein EBT19_05030 [Methylocystaceae bacterium]|nr:hypothetical protein [Methylocystaceae bacterium]NBV94757.1 hypothetical protein [Methylocystaceae bacterium]